MNTKVASIHARGDSHAIRFVNLGPASAYPARPTQSPAANPWLLRAAPTTPATASPCPPRARTPCSWLPSPAAVSIHAARAGGDA
jgi:hypothetical protein